MLRVAYEINIRTFPYAIPATLKILLSAGSRMRPAESPCPRVQNKA
jgi:hypothetical protein